MSLSVSIHFEDAARIDWQTFEAEGWERPLGSVQIWWKGGGYLPLIFSSPNQVERLAAALDQLAQEMRRDVAGKLPDQVEAHPSGGVAE